MICSLLYPRHSLYAEGYIVFVFPFVCSSFHHIIGTLRQSVCVKVSQMGISQQPLIRKQRTWVVGTSEGLLTFGKFWTLGLPWVVAGVQNLGHSKKCYTAFSFMLTPSVDIRADISHPYESAFHVMR